MIINHETNPLDIMIRRGVWQKDLSYLHRHEKIEIIRCMEESFGVLIDGVRFEVKKGDILVIGEQKIHNFYIYEDNTNYYLLQFPLSVLLNNGIIPSQIKPVITKEELDLKENLSRHIDSIFQLLESEGNIPIGTKNPASESLCASLYFLLMNRFGENEVLQPSTHEKSEFYTILEYVNENYTRDITVSSTATAMFMDRGRRSKLFLKYSGMKLTHYINSLRLSKALSLIEKGESVTTSALDSGFQSVRTFNDVYKTFKNKKSV